MQAWKGKSARIILIACKCRHNKNYCYINCHEFWCVDFFSNIHTKWFMNQASHKERGSMSRVTFPNGHFDQSHLKLDLTFDLSHNRDHITFILPLWIVFTVCEDKWNMLKFHLTFDLGWSCMFDSHYLQYIVFPEFESANRNKF